MKLIVPLHITQISFTLPNYTAHGQSIDSFKHKGDKYGVKRAYDIDIPQLGSVCNNFCVACNAYLCVTTKKV